MEWFEKVIEAWHWQRRVQAAYDQDATLLPALRSANRDFDRAVNLGRS